MAVFEKLKSGDIVFVGWKYCDKVTAESGPLVIKKVTAKQAATKSGLRFRLEDGMVIGSRSYHREWIYPITIEGGQEAVDEYLDVQAKAQRLSKAKRSLSSSIEKLQRNYFGNFSVELLEQCAIALENAIESAEKEGRK